MKILKRSFCPISSALDLLGDKWTLLIVRDLIFRHKNTFKDFLDSDEKIATNILSDRLSRLESLEIISKNEHPQSKAMNLYCLTKKGLDLMPILFEFIVWSDKYLEISSQGHSLAQKIRNNRQEIFDRFSKELSKSST